MNCTQELDEILAGALGTTLDVTNADAGEIYLVDEETGDLLLKTYQGVSAAFASDEAIICGGDCLCGLAVETAEPIATANLAEHPERSRPACIREGFRSHMSLPLRARERVLGLLNVQSFSTREFSPDDEELLTAIGNQIGVAIANAQLIEHAEQRRATLDSVMLSLVDGLILIDRSDRIVYVNPRAEELLGLRADALLGDHVAAIDRHVAGRLASAKTASTLDAAAMDLEGQSSLEITLLGTTPRSLKLRFFSIDADGGNSLGLGLLLRDITREKELDEMKSQLLATVSHELRTPLASIKGFATTLLREDVVWDEETRREFLSIIDKESDRLSELIGNLLEMSRAEAGMLSVEPEPMELGPLLDETAAEFRALTSEHHFTTNVPDSLPWVVADRRRSRQVVRNLVENAVKYSPAGGPVAVSAVVEGGFVRVSVADQGLGIAAEHLRHVFDPFYQVDSASTRRVGGSGLGLSICKAIVEAHGGRLWAQSKPGSGSTFHFTLPVHQPASPVPTADLVRTAGPVRAGERPD